MPFRYLADPLFLACLGLYVANRWLLEPSMPGQFFRSHLNDLICIPFCVPLMLYLLRELRLRRDDRPPQAYEILLPLILWSVVFELWLPTISVFRGRATPDHVDILCYVTGALFAAAWWNWYYRGGCQRSGSVALPK